MGTIIVALLAITMAILPISMPQAVATAGHSHASADVGHEPAASAEDHEHVTASSGDTVSAGLSDHDGVTQDCAGVICCSMGTCHAVQVGTLPNVYSPAVSQVPMTMPGDEQIAGITPGGLDRPPRTV